MASRHSLTALLLAFFMTGSVPAAAQTETWLKAVVNHVDKPYQVLVFSDAAGHKYLREIDVKELGLPTGGKPGYKHAGEWYYRLDELYEFNAYVDDISQRIYFASQAGPHIDQPRSKQLLLDAIVNGQRLPEPLFMEYESGEILLSESALKAIGIDEKFARLLLKDRDALPLHAVAGERFAIDYSRLTLNMTMRPQQFLPTRIRVGPADDRTVTPEDDISVMLAYDIATGIDAERNRWNAGMVDLAAAGGTTTCRSRHVRGPDQDTAQRLESGCTLDWPKETISLHIGDDTSLPGNFGQVVRYGGIRLGTDYGLAPTFVTQPTLSVVGSARVPSVLEVWVDQMLQTRQEVNPGVFEMNDIPLHTGSGEVRAVITNQLGVREIVSQSFYSDVSLLAEGLADWKFQAGRLRQDIGLPTDQYTDRFGLFDFRYGVTDWLTVNPRVEAIDRSKMGSLSIALRLGSIGVLEGFQATSATDDDIRGTAKGAHFSRRGEYVSMTLSHRVSDENFLQLGYPQPGETPAEESQASVGFSLPLGMSMSLGGMRRRHHDGESREFRTGSLSIPFGPLGKLLISAFQPVEPEGERFISAILTIPFGRRSNATASSFRQGNYEGKQFGLQQNPPSGPGFGYRIEGGSSRGVRHSTGELVAQGDIARLRISGRKIDQSTTGEAELSGGVIFSGNGMNLARVGEGSAAVVNLPVAGVGVYHDERLVAVTDSNGTAVIPGLRPYERNQLRIEADDLPLDINITDLERSVTPGRRQAVTTTFGVSHVRYVQAHLRFSPGGKPVPAGSKVTIAGENEKWPVGNDGLIFINLDTSESVQLSVELPQNEQPGREQCSVLLAASPGTEKKIVRLGEVICR